MDEFLAERCSPWLRAEGPDHDVVVSSRVRLARNVAGFEFTSRCGEADLKALHDLMHRHLDEAFKQTEVASGRAAITGRREMVWLELRHTPPIQRRVLMERRLISKQLMSSDGPGAVMVALPDEGLSVMVNEEDHLRLQAVRPGLDLAAAFGDVDRADDALEARTDYAYHPRFGYLTACPTNVGTGLRVSVMLHLPALKLTGELEKVQRAAKAMSLAVRGWMGEGSEAAGDFFQISNQTTLGKSEQELLGDFETRVIPQVVDYERQAREQLLTKQPVFLEDQVHRALGLLRSARLLKTEEAMALLSHARLGATAGLHEVPLTVLNELSVLVQPGHLQRYAGRAMEQAERRKARASLCREMLAHTG